MANSGAECDDVMRVSPAGKTSSYQTGRAMNTMEPRVYSVQQTKVEICSDVACDYCEFSNRKCRAQWCGSFKGRKLSTIC